MNLKDKAKQKAEELYRGFLIITLVPNRAKRCATLAVDELIKVDAQGRDLGYYETVKQEIKNYYIGHKQ